MSCSANLEDGCTMVDLDECTPVAEDAVTNLTSAEAYDYLSKAGSGKLQLSAVPPV